MQPRPRRKDAQARTRTGEIEVSYDNKDSIARIGGTFDNGRRGEPQPGCDCMRCFGYCMIDKDQALRERLLANDQRWQGRRRESAELTFEDIA